MRFLRYFFVLAVLAAGVAGYLLYAPVTPPQGEIYVDLPTGTSTQAMAAKLQDARVLRSRYAFLLLRVVRDGSLRAGEYRFAEPASAATIYARIARGDVSTLAVSIPEGFNLFDIAHAVEVAGLAKNADFLVAAHTNTALIAEWSPRATSLEGYLYPDTYRFSHHATPRIMLEAMVKRFRAAAREAGLRENVARTVTLASLVEKEVHFNDERTMAAGVFENRLRLGMPLQTDPTVIYAAELDGRWHGVIHRSDLDSVSAYNTYRHGGLPPGPICSPGVAALRAAMHPAVTNNLYFVADAAGHTRFSETLRQHADQVEDYRRALGQ